MLKSTKKHTKYWSDRVMNWEKDYFDTWTHPHRALIVHMIKGMPVGNLWEVGCGGGANIMRIMHDLPGFQEAHRIGGSDVNADAIEFCIKKFGGGLWHVESGENLMMSDKSIDLLLTDMALIYVDPFKIDKYLKEFKRVSKGYVLFCEFHSNSWWKRLKARLGGYHVYDYRKRLEKLGYYDIMVQHIPEPYWPGTDNNTEFRSIISARV